MYALTPVGNLVKSQTDAKKIGCLILTTGIGVGPLPGAEKGSRKDHVGFANRASTPNRNPVLSGLTIFRPWQVNRMTSWAARHRSVGSLRRLIAL